jgi:hypothetical protein
MSGSPALCVDVHSPTVAPYFTWDAPMANADIRRVLAEGPEEERTRWIAHILREARYEDVWAYVSLRRDVLPRWDQIRRQLGRRRAMWEFLIARWRALGRI